MKEDSSEDISGSSIDDDSSIASNASRTGEAEDLDLDNGGEQAMDGEEDEEPEMPMHRGGIGNRGGVGSARAGLGMSFAPATPVSQEALDPSLRTGTPNLNTRGGIGSQSRMTFAPSSRSNQKFLSEDTARQEPPPPSVAETTATEDAAQTVGASPTAPPFPASETPADVASAFTARTPRAFVRSSKPTEPVVAPVQLSYEERAHFAKISGGFGARMMAKMGWEAVSDLQL
jgi:tuftelin-interacting protein 11